MDGKECGNFVFLFDEVPGRRYYISRNSKPFVRLG